MKTWIALFLLSILLITVDAVEAAPSAQSVYRKALPSVATLLVEGHDGSLSRGTGFLALGDGVLVTSWHVVQGAKAVTARFENGKALRIEGLIDKDERDDLAIVRVDSAGLPKLVLTKAKPPVASRVYTIGAPQGLDFSISDGLISQIREVDGREVYQFTAPVSHGNSGGPLLSAEGRVVGVVRGGYADGQNLNFATPAARVLTLDTTQAVTPFERAAETAARVPPIERTGRTPASPGRSSGDTLTLRGTKPGRLDVSRLAQFFETHGVTARAVDEDSLVLEHASQSWFVTIILDDIDRLVFHLPYRVKLLFRASDALRRAVLAWNAKYNFASFSIHNDELLMITTHMTFVDDVTWAELEPFLGFLRTSTLAFAVTSEVRRFVE